MTYPTRWQKIGIQGPLGFSAGLPLLLTGSTLTAWLATDGVSLQAIGAFALVSLPYNLKWLWAPLLDRYQVPFLGRRLGWILVFQLLLAVAIAVLGAIDAPSNLGTLALLALAVTTLSASQDVLIDAYRTDSLGAGERGKGAAAYIMGYRLGMIVAGSGALLMADYISWRAVYFIEAGLLSIGVIATLLAPNPETMPAPHSLREALLQPLGEFFNRRGAMVAILFVMMFKVGDSVAEHMITPFLLLELNFQLQEIALIQKLLGISAAIVGAAVGGVLVDKFEVRRALLWFGLAQALANSGYLALALIGKSHIGLMLAIAVDSLCTGLGAAAFVAYLMSICHPRFSATQYALLASASSVLGRLLNVGSGHVIAAIGWAGFFGVTMVIAGPALLLWRWLPESFDGDRDYDDEASPTPARPLYRLLAGGLTLACLVGALWRLIVGDWKLAIGLTVVTLAFSAYVLVSGRSTDGAH